ncbi:MAG TPA: competence/damage-inducible protein A [Fervidobacterium sp.]|jgi:nicotinamide-nucleotide amidase|nr:competence/damage-inducible protein A [Fervidobacterium sp.]HRT01681.1 competence/damage-inducible protein A [Fervidobacterium sp.]HUM76368.1 competence/damage-inducible protein A [Fervidobacterium sp.]
MLKSAIILAIGNELVEGLILDTNSKYMSQRLKLAGYYVVRTETLPDNLQIMKDRISVALQDADLIITSGGLGPTEDDITREAVSAVIGRKLIVDKKLSDELVQRAIKYYGKSAESVSKQAMIIEGATVLDNPVGTAPGQLVEVNGKIILILPGPPSELIPIFENVYDKIKADDSLYTRRIKTIGIPEAILMEEYKDIIYSDPNVTVATMASYERGVEVRFTGPISLKDSIDRICDRLIPMLGDSVYALDDSDMQDVVYKLLKDNGLTVSFAESCTGGLISSTFVDIPGVSDVYKGGVITYSNESKMKILGVAQETLEKHGAVSEECVREMVDGCKRLFNSSFAVAVSGIAGPSGESEEKPVGTVCIALATPTKIISSTHLLRGDRNSIRRRSMLFSFDILRRGVLEWLGLREISKK